jgi:hypothetical protein
MPFPALAVLSWFGTIKSIIKRIPWQVYAGLAVLAVWYWERDNHADNREAYTRAEMQVIIDRKEAARLAAVQESLRIAALNSKATEKANADVSRNLVQERAGADAFIARGGVRRCPAAGANTPAADQSPGFDAGTGQVSELDELRPDVVTVLPDDVRICTENSVKARAWREWGLSVVANQAGE